MESDANKIRHVCISNDYHESVIYKAKNLRTLMFKSYRTVPDVLIDKLECLRTLDLRNSNLKEVTKEVGMLLHLRYLRLESSDLLELPETICNLYNLQSLILNECRRFSKLPNGIGKLKNLRHLGIEETSLEYIPSGIGRLSSLRTLSKFIVGGSSRSDLEGCKISDLKSLNNLGGYLKIEGLSRVSDVNEAKEAELKKKINIRKLKLEFGLEFGCDWGATSGMEKDVVERLEPHENLEGLDIRNYPGSHFPSWMENSSTLANLTELKLYQCEKCTQWPALDKLESLQKLEVHELRSVKNIKHEFPKNGVIFPKLKELRFWNMSEWEEWSIPLERDGVIFPELKYLNLYDCPKLKLHLLDFTKFKSLESLMLCGLGSWEGSHKNEEEEEDGCSTSMGYLKELEIIGCSKLKVIPHYLFPDTLRTLTISYCPELMKGMQPCVPPLLEKLELSGNTGGFPESLQQCSLSLRKLGLNHWPHSSMPKAFNQLKALEKLNLNKCETLDFELNELKHFTTLRSLEIFKCRLLEQRFGSSGEAEWRSILSHVPVIYINFKRISNSGSDSEFDLMDMFL